jgi:hypothetical protein
LRVCFQKGGLLVLQGRTERIGDIAPRVQGNVLRAWARHEWGMK